MSNDDESKICICGSDLHLVPVLGDDQQCDIEDDKTKWGKIASIAVVVAILIYIIIDFSFFGQLKGALEGILLFIERNGVLGVVVFIAIFVLATITLFPPVLLTYGAGFAFSMCYGILIGTIIGSISVLIGAFIGSIAAFTFGRYVIRDTVSRWCAKYKILHAIDVAVGVQGFKVSALLRISPLIPFGVLNYLFAVTRISFRDFALGTVGIVPGTIAFVLIGALSGETVAMEDTEGSHTTRVVLFALGGVATLVAIIYVAVHTKRILKQTLAESAAESTVDVEAARQCPVCSPFVDNYIDTRLASSFTELEDDPSATPP